MAEPEGTAGVESTGDLDDPVEGSIDMQMGVAGASADGAGAAGERGAESSGEDGSEADEPAQKAPEPPRRRLVAELLEGQEVVAETSRPGLQLVAPPLHLETIDAGQPIYQLDLSSDEPEAVLVERERAAASRDDDAPTNAAGASDPAAPGSVRDIVKKLIMQRDRYVMAAERDGIGAYELAVGLDAFVDKVLEAATDR